MEEPEKGSEVASSYSPPCRDMWDGCSMDAYDEAGLSVISISSSPRMLGVMSDQGLDEQEEDDLARLW